MSKIRVLVVDDSSFLRMILPRILQGDPEIEVIGTAADGSQAIEMTKELRPDVVTLDVMMPVMDGLEALKRIMAESPTAVVMLSSATKDGSDEAADALSLGAVDIVTKPSGPVSPNIAEVSAELVDKVKAAPAKWRVAATGDRGNGA